MDAVTEEAAAVALATGAAQVAEVTSKEEKLEEGEVKTNEKESAKEPQVAALPSSGDDGVAAADSWPARLAAARAVIERNLSFYTKQFAEETMQFSKEKTSALVSIVNQVHRQSSDQRLTFDRSFDRLKTELLRHSVQRVPFSIGLFSLRDLRNIIPYLLSTYYQHYKLYQYAFTRRCTKTLTTSEEHEPELPPALSPLSEAITQAEMDSQFEKERKAEREEEEKREEEARLAAMREKQKQIEDEFRSNIPDDVLEKVQRVVAEHMEKMKVELQADFESREKEVLERLSKLTGEGGTSGRGGGKRAGGEGDGGGSKKASTSKKSTPQATGRNTPERKRRNTPEPKGKKSSMKPAAS
ncbi:hypothetical protein CBR_g38558 [Chara braunii]|uniref:Uncharacterized protein n=1 Tax=Chara braunii TaxID=69332 RepID=A0A388K098_CHABU|nr:hypothetical protein CBR_g38558 [Chara braunii]|eukprot:GBG63490.1 hypothetical protein CBR_g38558 [Chara braunii]